MLWIKLFIQDAVGCLFGLVCQQSHEKAIEKKKFKIFEGKVPVVSVDRFTFQLSERFLKALNIMNIHHLTPTSMLLFIFCAYQVLLMPLNDGRMLPSACTDVMALHLMPWFLGSHEHKLI